MKNRIGRIIEDLRALHSQSTHPKDKPDLINRISESEKELNAEELESLKNSKDPIVFDWFNQKV